MHIRHCTDVMHVEKNVCDSVIGTLLNIHDKTKDEDLAEMGIRSQLHPMSDGKKIYLSPAFHTLSRKEKISFCQCLKSHDCHVLMQQLLAIAIQDILPKKVRHAITRLCFFFNVICSKVIDPLKLDELENKAALSYVNWRCIFLLYSSTSWLT